MLIKRNIDINNIDNNENSLFQVLLNINNDENSFFQVLLNKGYIDTLLTKMDLNHENIKGETLLFTLIINNNTDTIKNIIIKVIELGANVNFINRNNEAALLLAVKSKSLSIIKLLLIMVQK